MWLFVSSTVGVALVATLTSGCQSAAFDRATAVGTETCTIEIVVELPDPDDPDASRLGFDTPDEALAAFAAEQTAARERTELLPSDDVARLEADAVARVATAALSQIDSTLGRRPAVVLLRRNVAWARTCAVAADRGTMARGRPPRSSRFHRLPSRGVEDLPLVRRAVSPELPLPKP